jgi:replicative DNA helicase
MASAVQREQVIPEQALCGAVAFDKDVLPLVQGLGLQPGDFADWKARAIYEAAMRVSERHAGVVDMVMLYEDFDVSGLSARFDARQYLQGCIDHMVTYTHAAYYARLVMEASLRRRMELLCLSASQAAAGCEDIEEHRSKTETALADLNTRTRPTETAAAVAETIAGKVADINLGKGVIQDPMIPTGFGHLDNILGGGMKPGGVYWLAGEKATGKTAFMLNVIWHQIRNRRNVAVATLEMTPYQLTERLMGIALSHDIGRVLRGKESVGNQAVAEFREVLGHRLQCETQIQDTAALWSWARRMVSHFKAELLCVDYLQRLKPRGGSSLELFERVTMASEEVTAIAHGLHVPILAISQLSNDGKLRGSRQMDYDSFGTFILTADDSTSPQPPDYEKAVSLYIDKSRFSAEHITQEFRYFGRTGRYQEEYKGGTVVTSITNDSGVEEFT